MPESGGILDQDDSVMEAMTMTRYIRWLSTSEPKTWKRDDLEFKAALDKAATNGT